MGTTDNFDSPDATDFGLSDQVPIKDATTSRAGYATGAYMLSGLAGVVNTTATTLAITQALHGNRTVTISSAAPIAITLPQATGSGAKYRFQVQVVATATGHTIKVANATDVMQGAVVCLTTATDIVVTYFATSATSDTITLNGTTKGGVVGAWYEIVDVKTGFFQVFGVDLPTGSIATPFSAAVP